MTIRKNPENKPSIIDMNVIEKGAYVASDKIKKNENWEYIQLRVSCEMLENIKNILLTERKGMSRNAWILEAIQEKLKN